ncbi:P44 outermembrane protein, silent [Anaplasma phagocytophilum]|uniref:p44 outermembrane protein, silent n=1 Tax=Anaplasma phagocytophilum TaxID=948 RepID=A0A098GJH1_ANAPH|nr:P44 outermembrane protein, silent [Anaplasma phagocytophilum]
MMLLLDRLTSLLLLLPKPLVKTSFSLLRRWRFLPRGSMGRFVRQGRRGMTQLVGKVRGMVRTLVVRGRKGRPTGVQLCVVTRVTRVTTGA